MTYQEAATKLRAMANGKHASIEYSIGLFTDGEDCQRIRLYIADVGLTEYQRSYDLAFAELESMMAGTLPTIEEQLPPMFEGVTK